MTTATQTFQGVFTTGVNTFSFVVPSGVTVLDVTANGAPGGSTQNAQVVAGRGATFHGILGVTPGETLTIRPGNIGGNGSANTIQSGNGLGGLPYGANGGLIGTAGNRGGGGGGASVISRGATAILIVAGGGGCPARKASGSDFVGDGTSPNQNGYKGSRTLGGGGATAPSGPGGSAGDASASAGGLLAGGLGASGTGNGGTIGNLFSGGGGGGGYYGGGGGGRSATTNVSGGGGGGISFLDGSSGWTSVTWPSDARSNFRPGSDNTGNPTAGRIILLWTLPATGGWSLGLASLLG